MAGASSDGEMNYWPGFVDALANLVLALVFVVVIFTLALAVISSKVAKGMAEKEVERIRELESSKTVQQQMQQQIVQMKQELIEKDQQLKAQINVKAAPTPTVQSKMSAIRGSEITFTYDPNAFELGAEPLAELDKLIKQKGGIAGKSISLVAYPGSGPFSSEKRAAYYRMVTLRNLLIERGVSPASITTRTASDSVLPGVQGQVKLSLGGA